MFGTINTYYDSVLPVGQGYTETFRHVLESQNINNSV